ncbi:hypothetical protein [Phenylobacterium sp.]|uniref:hypothetical protein n=1 Tax=Phenylobacterium sp. TaxID=1871053 RepID=UPI003BAC0255
MEPVAQAAAEAVNRLLIQLRAYVASEPSSRDKAERPWTSDIAVVFDTETAVDPSQRLRFGSYQVRHRGGLLERGLFYADDAPAADVAALRAYFREMGATEAGERLRLLSRAEFVEEVIFKWGYEDRGLIVGFNLPFDISRIATGHTYAKGSMQGGFSFELAPRRPNIRVKHLSRRAAFIDFAGKDGDDKRPDHGLFLDVKTLSAALTGQSHTLEGLAELLKTAPKSPLDDYGGELTPEKISYCLNDTEVTWQCFAKLAGRFEAFGLTRTELYDLYSEASLGKAYLQTMGVQPWRRAQRDFPPELIGQIMSTYYGGRAEVHIRREIVPVLHCDFLSMYPTVCTLMGLWRFVIAKGMSWSDATADVRAIVEATDLRALQDPQTWLQLHCIVQVQPDDDVFPVRAQYAPDQPATIGVNYLTSREPMWFTLADVLAAKLLGAKAPKILSAIRFSALDPQAGLQPVQLAGVQLDPAKDDFYRSLINLRRKVQRREEDAAPADKPGLKAEQQGLKILANSTSYGIFVELNVRRLDRPKDVQLFDFRGVAQTIRARKVEDTGRYYHPLLASLITGAARLMLACAERNALDEGLDWAFCDTDSLSIANTAGLGDADFMARVARVRAWFEPLNPYDVKGSILQLEKYNYPEGQHGNEEVLRPLWCIAISAKRYALFDRDVDGAPVIRKGSAHGLGHMLPPYDDPDRTRMGRISVQLWQQDLWCEIIRAHDLGRPNRPDFSQLENIDGAAATRYAVTNQTMLAWFKGYNAGIAERDRVRPFNFLLTYQPKSKVEMMAMNPADELAGWGKRQPKPASRYSSDLINDRPEVFDRASGAHIPWGWLKTYRRALARHHLHSETKFLGGEDDAHGTLRRRHVHVLAAMPIGKEADNLDEREALGEEEEVLIWDALGSRQRLRSDIIQTIEEHQISDAKLCREAAVSHRTARALREGRRVALPSLARLAQAAEAIRLAAEASSRREADWYQLAQALSAELGSGNKLAAQLGVSGGYLHRVLTRQKPLSEALIERLRSIRPPS